MFKKYSVADDLLLDENGRIPLIYWDDSPNFGDLISPYIFEKITGREVALRSVKPSAPKFEHGSPTYIAVGSILSRAQDNSIAWGLGAFGTETKKQISIKANYRSVRGPLTRQLILNAGGHAPKSYGDPALIMPLLYYPNISKRYKLGIALRWSESTWLSKDVSDEGIKIIDLGRSDIEGVIDDFLSCDRILTSSLHGLIIADAYELPNCWLASSSPKGGVFKYYDYFLSVDKIRHACELEMDAMDLSLRNIMPSVEFDSRPAKIDLNRILDAAPILVSQ